MTRISSEELLEEFNIKYNNVIISLDSKHRLVTYIVDSTMRIIADYEKILKYYNR